MLQAMFNGVSAIQANQTAIDVIGNNIANVNTTAYKSGLVTFEDQLSQTLQGASSGNGSVGGTNPVQTGLGVRVASTGTLEAQGSLESTSVPTDLALQGNGYFMLGGDNGNVSYTRDGSFTVDNSGNLVNSATGAYVLGWQASPSGVVDSTTQLTAASHLTIPVGSLTATNPTSAVTYGGNLSADATPTSAPYTRSVKFYDSQGDSHTLTLSFTKTSNPNQWSWSASDGSTPPDPKIAGVTPAAGGSGTVTFNADGSYKSMTGGSIGVTYVAGSGLAASQKIAPDFSGISQVAGDSSAAPTGQDGYAPGTLQSFNIDQTGTVTGIFSNGFTRSLGQIALADFANPEGLARSGGNGFAATSNSGLPQVGQATQGSLGKISAGYLEQSNVDLSSEFTNMIITQRGFQANTKIVSTVDQMLNDVISMKQG